MTDGIQEILAGGEGGEGGQRLWKSRQKGRLNLKKSSAGVKILKERAVARLLQRRV